MASHLQDVLFPLKFGLSINTCRSTLLVFGTRRIVWIAPKYIVRRNMYQEPVHFFHGDGQVFYSCSIQQGTEVDILFCLVHIGIGCTVDNHLHLLLGYHFTDSIQIGNVQFCYIGKDIMVLAAFGDDSHFVSQLAIGTCNEYIHISQIPDKGSYYNQKENQNPSNRHA